MNYDEFREALKGIGNPFYIHEDGFECFNWRDHDIDIELEISGTKHSWLVLDDADIDLNLNLLEDRLRCLDILKLSVDKEFSIFKRAYFKDHEILNLNTAIGK